MIHSPSKYISLARLEQIKRDHCLGASGKEYSECELDMAIAEKYDQMMDSFDFEEVDRLAKAPKVIVMPPYPRVLRIPAPPKESAYV